MEFPNAPLPTFKPLLEALQKMSLTLNLPFANLIAPEAGDKEAKVQVPLYARRRGFEFDLSELTGGIPMTFSPAQEFDREAFSALSSLDEA